MSELKVAHPEVQEPRFPIPGAPERGSHPSLAGLSTPLAAWRILVRRGVDTSIRHLEEEEGEGLRASGLVQTLRNHGLEARAVDVPLDDLSHLQLPTLLGTGDETWTLLRKRTRKGWVVEDALGTRTVPASLLQAAYTGFALEIGETFPETGSLWSRLFRLLPEHRGLLLITLAASGMVQGLSLLSPYLTAKLMDGALAGGASGLLQILCLGMLLTALFRAWVGWLRDVTLHAFSARIDVALEKGLFDHLLHLPFKHLQSKTLGELLQAFSGIKRARALVLNRGLSALFDACTVVAYLIYMQVLMPAMAGVVALGALILALATTVIGYLKARAVRLQVKASQAEHSALAELIVGAPTLKATGSQHWVLGRWKERLGVELRHNLRQERLGLWEDGVHEFLNQGSSICVLIWGGFKVLEGELSLGQLLAFSQLSGSFMGAVTNLSQMVLAIAQAKPQMEEAQTTFETPAQPRAVHSGTRCLAGPVVVEDLWFRYSEKGPWIIQGTSFEASPGAFHPIEGASGSGKSTLLKLMAGLYAPSSGRISLGGLNPSEARELMAFLPQFPQLSSTSILENLRIFSGNASRAHLLEVASETGLDEWVKTLPMGYQTKVAAKGSNLSGGQRQLVAITAVLASPKPILLLDEALSNLDWVSRQRILQSPRFRGRTIIYASHEEVLGVPMSGSKLVV